jgi:hypothetical protein
LRSASGSPPPAKGPFAHETANANVQQTATTNGPVETNARHFKRIPGAAPTESSTPDGQPWIGSVTVTVVVKSGKGALRVIDGENNDPADGSRMYPASVNIAGKGPHTVTFILGADQDYVFPPEPQWKRTGDRSLKAKTVVTSIQGSVV